MKKILFCLFLVLPLSISIGCSPNPIPNKKTVKREIPYESQDKTNWCAQACIQMCVEYKIKQNKDPRFYYWYLGQLVISNYLFGYKDEEKNEGPTISQLPNLLTHFVKKEGYDSNFKAEEISPFFYDSFKESFLDYHKKVIDSSEIAIVVLAMPIYNNQGILVYDGHATVITGYEIPVGENDGNEITKIFFHDPNFFIDGEHREEDVSDWKTLTYLPKKINYNKQRVMVTDEKRLK